MQEQDFFPQCLTQDVPVCFVFSVYENGACFSPDVLDITSEDLLMRFVEVLEEIIIANIK